CLFCINFVAYTNKNYGNLECQASDLWALTTVCVLIWCLTAMVGSIMAGLHWRGALAVVFWVMYALTTAMVGTVIWALCQTADILPEAHSPVMYTTIVLVNAR